MSQSPTYSIFISSTTDLAHYRMRARDLILTYGFRPLEMEYFPAESRSVPDVIDSYLDASDGMILIAGGRYGSRIGEISYVEWEFSEARSRGIPIACLVMEESLRHSHKASEDDWESQQRFIEQLKVGSKVAEFDDTSFERLFASTLRLLPEQFRPGAGLIPLFAYEELRDSSARTIRHLTTHRRTVRLLAGMGLTQSHVTPAERTSMPPKRPVDERAVLDNLFDLLYQDLGASPVATEIIEGLIRRYISRLHGFTSPSGFVPDSIGELEVCLDELFGETLSVLKATSIHSAKPEFAAYKGYWEDPELGPFFKQKNSDFLVRVPAGQTMRVFVCDSLADSVGEGWFTSTVIPQITQGAQVKIVEIGQNPKEYEDFGVYEHGPQTSAGAGAYVLLAPREENKRRPGLATAVMADRQSVGRYSRKFETLWRQSPESLQILTSSEAEAARGRPLRRFGDGRITDIFGRKVILRRMKRLDTGERLVPPSAGYVRKYQPQYAKALSDHLRRRFPNADRLAYIGDTHKNDGGVIRNLQALDWDVTGFVCEPRLDINNLWFNQVLYTGHWTDLVLFAQRLQHSAGPRMVALFDIDQTLWAPKGVHEAPLAQSRTRAMYRLVDEYMTDASPSLVTLVKERIELLYAELEKVKYLSLTLDNEDFKAALCVFLSLNLIFDQERIGGVGLDAGAGFFEELARLAPPNFVGRVKEEYLGSFVVANRDREAGITHFLMEALSAAETYQFGLFGEASGIRVARVSEHLREIFRNTVGAAPIQYLSFRSMELDETLRRIDGSAEVGDQLVLSKPAWDIAQWLKGSGTTLMALSDRPDESTVSGDGRSLLDATMTIYGTEIVDLLPAN